MVKLARTRAAINHLVTTPLALYFIAYPVLTWRGLDLTSYTWPAVATVLFQLAVCLVAEVKLYCIVLCCAHRAFSGLFVLLVTSVAALRSSLPRHTQGTELIMM